MLGARRAEKIAGGKNVDAGHFQIRGEDASWILQVLAGQVRRQDTRLLISRLYQAVAYAAVFSALPNRIDAGAAGLQIVVDEDTAIDTEVSRACEFDIWTNPRRDHDEIRFNLCAVLEHDRLGAALAYQF